MKVAIMQPYLFPYIGYFQLINAVDTFVIFDDVNYINRGWINRNYILANGKKHLFTLKLSRSSQNILIKDTHILDEKNNRIKLLKSITLNYARAPYFKETFDILQHVILNDCGMLGEYVTKSLIEISKYLDIKTRFIKSSSVEKVTGLKRDEKLIKISKIMKADTYINPIGGTVLYNREYFRERDVKLLFLKPNEIVYRQFKNQFVPNLSIIDVLMFNSKNDIKKMLQNYLLF